MIFPLCKWYFDINWHRFEKRWADVFQSYPNAIYLNSLQFCPSMPLLGFPVFCSSFSIVLNRYFHILVNSVTIWSVLKLPKIAWPSSFKLAFSGIRSTFLPGQEERDHGRNAGSFPGQRLLIEHMLETMCFAALNLLSEKDTPVGKSWGRHLEDLWGVSGMPSVHKLTAWNKICKKWRMTYAHWYKKEASALK